MSQAPSCFSLVTHAAPSSWNTLPSLSSPASPPVPVSSLRSRSDPAGWPSLTSPQALLSPVRASHGGCRCDFPPVRPPVPAVSSLRADVRLPLQLPWHWCLGGACEECRIPGPSSDLQTMLHFRKISGHSHIQRPLLHTSVSLERGEREARSKGVRIPPSFCH